METIEGAFSCNGICNYGIFYYSLDLSYGPPSTACKEDLKKLANDSTYRIGVCLIFSFIFTSIGFVMQYYFCCQCCKRIEELANSIDNSVNNAKALPNTSFSTTTFQTPWGTNN